MDARIRRGASNDRFRVAASHARFLRSIRPRRDRILRPPARVAVFPNAVVALVGPLGAGKTQLTRAVAEGLNISNPAAVTSPTFTLIHEYPARLPIFHFDAYRLKGADEFLDLGAAEYYDAGGVCLIEWADRVVGALPEERLNIRIEPMDEHRRRVEVIGHGTRYEQLAKDLASGSP